MWCEPRHPSENTAKYMQNTNWPERGYFIRDIISPSCVNKTDKNQASPELVYLLPSFYDFFFQYIFPCRGGVTARLQPQERLPTFGKINELE